jgi:hypothetical protein
MQHLLSPGRFRLASMTEWTPQEELAGRLAFNRYRDRPEGQHVTWDWADLSDTEKQMWIDRAKGQQAKA